jgi:putative Holliday junction resolvase
MAARDFAKRLGSRVQVPVDLYDERFTTSIAAARGGGGSVDSRAAAVLLEDYLARHPA